MSEKFAHYTIIFKMSFDNYNAETVIDVSATLISHYKHPQSPPSHALFSGRINKTEK